MTKRLQPDDIPFPWQPARDLTLTPRIEPSTSPQDRRYGAIPRSEAFLVEHMAMSGPAVIRARLENADAYDETPRRLQISDQDNAWNDPGRPEAGTPPPGSTRHEAVPGGRPAVPVRLRDGAMSRIQRETVPGVLTPTVDMPATPNEARYTASWTITPRYHEPDPPLMAFVELPPRLPVRAPIRRERDIRLQSLSLLLAGALAGLVYALVILALWRALGN